MSNYIQLMSNTRLVNVGYQVYSHMDMNVSKAYSPVDSRVTAAEKAMVSFIKCPSLFIPATIKLGAQGIIENNK